MLPTLAWKPRKNSTDKTLLGCRLKDNISSGQRFGFSNAGNFPPSALQSKLLTPPSFCALLVGIVPDLLLSQIPAYIWRCVTWGVELFAKKGWLLCAWGAESMISAVSNVLKQNNTPSVFASSSGGAHTPNEWLLRVSFVSIWHFHKKNPEKTYRDFLDWWFLRQYGFD